MAIAAIHGPTRSYGRRALARARRCVAGIIRSPLVSYFRWFVVLVMSLLLSFCCCRKKWSLGPILQAHLVHVRRAPDVRGESERRSTPRRRSRGGGRRPCPRRPWSAPRAWERHAVPGTLLARRSC